jgi:hypothetical protein
MFGSMSAQTHAVHDAVENASDGGEAIATLDDFRLAFLQAQLVRPGSVRFTPEQFARLRPLNDLAYGGASKLVAEQWKTRRGRVRIEPRLLVFLAHASALGILTMKGLVESLGDPLVYSDEQLIEGLAQIFEAAAQP